MKDAFVAEMASELRVKVQEYSELRAQHNALQGRIRAQQKALQAIALLIRSEGGVCHLPWESGATADAVVAPLPR